MKINYPYPRKRQKGRGVRIEVGADSMRVGKTTAVKVIAEGLKQRGHVVTESYEDWQHNPYLQGSYADPAKNFLDSQKWFVQRKWEQVRDGAGKGIFLQDVHPEMDYCYAATNMQLGRMSQGHFRDYEEFFQSLDWSRAPAPDLLVYLTVSDEELIRRATASRREFETVEPEYFLMMKKVNREWMEGVPGQYNLIMIDTDELDFANNMAAKQDLVERIAAKLGLRQA